MSQFSKWWGKQSPFTRDLLRAFPRALGNHAENQAVKFLNRRTGLPVGDLIEGALQRGPQIPASTDMAAQASAALENKTP